jgi:hypothetical protein
MLFLGLSASADTQSTSLFWGDWVGKGAYDKDGDLLSCDSIEMVFAGNEAGFDFVSGGRTCGSFKETFKHEHLDQKGNSLFSSGLAVGSLQDGNRIETKYSFPGPDGKNETYQMQLSVQGDLLFFAESLIIEGSLTPRLSANAMLERRSSRQ